MTNKIDIIKENLINTIKADGHNILYEEDWYLVFENSKLKPYEGWTEDIEILMLDLNLRVVLACGKWCPDLSIEGEALMGQGISFTSPNVEAMVRDVLEIERDLLYY